MPPKTYTGSCHCGLITYTVKLDEALAPEGTEKIGKCNCTICRKNGYLLVYPRREDVVFKDGCDARMKDYYMGKKIKAHRFCPECSSSILIDFKNADDDEQRPLLAMNAIMLDGVDLEKAEYDPFDGLNLL